MANASKPIGLSPSHYLNGASWNGAANRYYVPSTDTFAYYIGDVVKSAANGNTLNGAPAVELVTQAGSRGAAWTTGGPAARGVVVGFGAAVATPAGSIATAVDPNNLNIVYVPATKAYAYYLWVVDDPYVIFEAQTDTIANTSFNKNAPFYVAAAPTAPVAQSISYVQGSSPQTAAGYPIKIVGGPNRPDNDLTSPGTNGRIYCLINNHELRAGTAAI